MELNHSAIHLPTNQATMLRRYQLQSLVRGPRFPWYLVGVIGFFIVVTWFVAGCEKKVTRTSLSLR